MRPMPIVALMKKSQMLSADSNCEWLAQCASRFVFQSLTDIS